MANFKKDQSFPPRLGHSATVYRRQLLIYGGENLYNFHLKIRDCLGDLRLIDLETNECRNLRTYGDFIENRRNHASCLFSGKFLFISGGINSNGRYLNDLMCLNLEASKWSICICDLELDPIAFHTMLPIYRNDLKNIMDLYKSFDLEFKIKGGNTFNKIKEEGIYVFGGMDNHQQISNRLRVLKMGCYPLKWIEPETKGTPPMARYLHTMNFYQDLNIIIIYGGRNDQALEPVLSDVCVLNVFNLCWSKVSLFGLGQVPKCSHCATIVGSKLVVFGGYTLQEYSSSEVFVLELNQENVKSLNDKNKFNLGGVKEPGDLDESFKSENIQLEIKKESTFIRKMGKETFKTYMPIPMEKKRSSMKLI